MGRTTEPGKQPLYSVPGVERFGSQDGSAPGKATEELLEETCERWLLSFPVDMCCVLA